MFPSEGLGLTTFFPVHVKYDLCFLYKAYVDFLKKKYYFFEAGTVSDIWHSKTLMTDSSTNQIQEYIGGVECHLWSNIVMLS